jgi:hypothetical protein
VPNIEKYNFIIVRCPLRSTKISLKLGNNELKRVYQTKVLGVMIDHDLRFDDHIQNISINRPLIKLSLCHVCDTFYPKKP